MNRGKPLLPQKIIWKVKHVLLAIMKFSVDLFDIHSLNLLYYIGRYSLYTHRFIWFSFLDEEIPVMLVNRQYIAESYQTAIEKDTRKCVSNFNFHLYLSLIIWVLFSIASTVTIIAYWTICFKYISTWLSNHSVVKSLDY